MIMWGCITITEGIYRGKVNTSLKAELIFFHTGACLPRD